MASYTRVNWQNGDSGGTPINATNLNVMDEGIENLAEEINNITVTVTDDGDGNVTITIGGTT